MKSIKALVPAVAGLVMAGTAAASPVGVVSSVDGEALVVRGNETITVQSGDALMAGDRVITRSGATANVAAYGCSTSLDGASMVTVSESICGATPMAFSTAAVQGDGFATTEMGMVITAAAVIAVPVIVAVATDDDDGFNEAPVSP